MQVRKFVTLFLLLFSAYFSIFAQKILEGKALSASVDKNLSGQGFSTILQPLSPTGQDEFAYNLILNFPPTRENPASESEKPGRSEVIFAFYQEEFHDNEKQILDFISFIKNMERKWSASFLFSALDKDSFNQGSSVHGTEVFAASVDDADLCCALAITLTSEKTNEIFTGGKNHTTPLWLTQRSTDSFFNCRKNYDYKDLLSAIYRLGIISGQKRLAYFFINEIPAIELHLKDSDQLSVIRQFAEDYQTDGTSEWDMHYIYINRGNIFKAFFINEKTIILIVLSVGILTILLLCVFSFVGKHGAKHKYEFIRSSYMIPITIALSFTSLYLGQYVVMLLSRIFDLNPIFQYGIKIVFSMLFISFLFIAQGFFKISVTAFMYGFLLSIVAVFNIFLFTTRDLTLFAIFASEYIIIYLSRTSKSLGSLIFYYILMLLPFIPYGTIIIQNAEAEEISRTVFTNPLGNLLLSFAIFPFQITWLRMLVFSNVRAGIKGYTMRKIIFSGTLAFILILAFIFAIIFSISHFIYRPDYRAQQKIEEKLLAEEKSTLSARVNKTEFSGMNTNHIRIKSGEAALRYEVKLHGSSREHAIYDSIYDYEILSENDESETYSFIIPDFPPQSITIDYAAPIDAKADIEITAYYRTEEEHVYRYEKRELKIE